MSKLESVGVALDISSPSAFVFAMDTQCHSQVACHSASVAPYFILRAEPCSTQHLQRMVVEWPAHQRISTAGRLFESAMTRSLLASLLIGKLLTSSFWPNLMGPLPWLYQCANCDSLPCHWCLKHRVDARQVPASTRSPHCEGKSWPHFPAINPNLFAVRTSHGIPQLLGPSRGLETCGRLQCLRCR